MRVIKVLDAVRVKDVEDKYGIPDDSLVTVVQELSKDKTYLVELCDNNGRMIDLYSLSEEQVENVESDFVPKNWDNFKQFLMNIQNLTDFDTKDNRDRFLKLSEEYGEFAREVAIDVGIPGTKKRETSREKLIEEGVDTIICVMSYLKNKNIRMKEKEFFEVANRKMQKWQDGMLDERGTDQSYDSNE